MPIQHYQEETSRQSFNSFPLLYAGMFIVLAYSVWLVVHSQVDALQQSHIIQEQQAELEQMKLQKAVQMRFLDYQKTASYIDRQAREHFGYAKVGETVVIVPENSDEAGQQVKDEQAAQNAQSQQKVTERNLDLWKEYFFGK